MERAPERPSPEERTSRRERIAERTGALRTYAAAGAVAALGVFTALAATNGETQPEQVPAAVPAASEAPATFDEPLDDDGMFGSRQDFFSEAPSGGLGSGSGSFGPPSMSGGS